jgi:hypothetical protein
MVVRVERVWGLKKFRRLRFHQSPEGDTTIAMGA